MEKTIKIILWIISLLSLYAVGNIGLGWFNTFGESTNYERINSVLLNLSYSYLAGLIFYLLVSYFPYKFRQDKFKPIIKTKTENLYNQINACVVTFHNVENNTLIQNITLPELKEKINKNDLYNLSFYSHLVGYQMNNFEFLNKTRQNIFSLIESILLYREYMSSFDIEQIESIKDSKYFHLIKVYENTPTAKMYYQSKLFKHELANEIFKIIDSVKKLN
jgi:hypothetical protein